MFIALLSSLMSATSQNRYFLLGQEMSNFLSVGDEVKVNILCELLL